jgi:hypothetical protein
MIEIELANPVILERLRFVSIMYNEIAKNKIIAAYLITLKICQQLI